jgi:hypothetical protein
MSAMTLPVSQIVARRQIRQVIYLALLFTVGAELLYLDTSNYRPDSHVLGVMMHESG